MVARPWIIVGYVPVLPHAPGFEAGSVILVEEPDVIRKRGIESAMAGAPMLRELVAWEYQLEASADPFFNSRPDLDPALVAPLVEYATPFAARLAERYGVPGAGAATARIMRDKALLRTVSRSAGIDNPVSQAVSDARDLQKFMEEHPGPVILKHADRQASLGAKVLRDPHEAETAWWECARADEGAMTPDRPVPVRLLAEQFVRGDEYSVEMLVRDGRPCFANVTAKQLFPGPHPVELGHLVPAPIDAALDALLRQRTEALLRSVGFGTGVVHCEWIVSDGVPYLVECAGRFPGDGITTLIEGAYQIDLADAYYALMRGDQLPALPQHAERGTAVRFLLAGPGRVTAVDGLEAARAADGVTHASVLHHPGDTIGPLRSSWDRAGSVMAQADTAAEAMERATRASELIHVTTVP
jgi:biotin carboxylase